MIEDPTRLCDEEGAPQSLVDALALLQRQLPSPDDVAHIERALQALPARPLVSSAARTKLFTLGSCVAVLGAGAVIATLQLAPGAIRSPVAPLQSVERSAAPEVEPPTAAEPAGSTPSQEASGAAPTSSLPQPQAASSAVPKPSLLEEPTQPRTTSGAAPPARGARAQTERAQPRTARSSSPSVGLPRPLSSQPSAAVASAPGPRLPTANPAQMKRVAPAALDMSGGEQAPPPKIDAEEAASGATELSLQLGERRAQLAAAPQDEAGILFRAKMAERHDPERALELLREHARHFPDGNYTEEREALMVRLYRRLGHAAQAEQLAKRFRERFPGSLYQVTLPR